MSWNDYAPLLWSYSKSSGTTVGNEERNQTVANNVGRPSGQRHTTMETAQKIIRQLDAITGETGPPKRKGISFM